MNVSLKKQLFRSFAQMITDLSTPQETEYFLKDFLTEKELDFYVKRLSIIYWLKKNRSKENIKINLGATNKEIEGAEKMLKTNGVKLAIKKMEAEEWANVWTERIKKFVKSGS